MHTVSILFVDQVGSTAQLSTLGDPAAAELHGQLHELLGRFLDEFDGTYEQFTGDGLMASFGSCVSALECGLAVQDTLRDFNNGRQPEQQLVLRMGLHTGEPLERSTGPYGTAVVVAARLCEQAGAGQLLASDVVRALVEPRRAFTFVPVGARRLKGFPIPVVCHLVLPFHPAASRLPVELNVDRGSPFTGRGVELGVLRQHFELARTGHASLVLLLGQKGAGKTRLVREFAAEVDALGGEVVALDPAALADGRSSVDALTGSSDSVVLVIVDDIHRLDQFNALEAAVDRRPADPLLLIATSENGELRSALPDDTKVLDLDGLSLASVQDLVESVELDDLVPDVIDLSADTAGLPGPVLDRLGRTSRAAAQTRLHAAVDRAVMVRAEETRALSEVTAGILVAQEPELTPVAVASGEAPYKGLVPYGQNDANLFCGREEATSELVARLTVSRFVAVTGSSGSGKSSLISAGLLAALGSDAIKGSAAWPVVRLTPGATPLIALARSLMEESGGESAEVLADRIRHRPTVLADLVTRQMMDRGDDRFVIVVDQFEEVFTQCRDERDREAFIDAVVHCAHVPDKPVSVVVALRGDYYGRCSEHGELARAAAASHFLVGPMTPSEIRYAVEEPARRTGLRIEPELADRAVDDASGQPGLLPLLSTAMLETWKRRDNGVLTLDGYESSGGVHGAISSLAESVYEHLATDERRVLRTILLRLAELGEDGDDVRRRAALDEVATDGQQRQVLDKLISHRLVTADETTVEVAHEALLREWPRLRVWLEEDRSGRRLHHRLTDDARTWDEGGRNHDLLYRGVRLEAALDWATAHDDELSPTESAFLTGSSEAWQEELAASQRISRRLRLLAAGLAALLVLALGAGFFANAQRTRADDRASAAEAARIVTLSDLALDQDVGLAALLAVEAWRSDQTSVSEGALLNAIGRFGAAETTIPIAALDVTFSPNGEAVIVTEFGEMVFWDFEAGQAVATIPGVSGFGPKVSSDGRYVVLVDYRPTEDNLAGGPQAVVWSVEDGAIAGTFPIPEQRDAYVGPVGQVAFDSDRERLVVASEEGTTVFDLASGSELAMLPPALVAVTLRAGDLGVLADLENLTVWDLDTLEVVDEFPIPPPPDGAPVGGFESLSVAQGPGREMIVAFDQRVLAVDLDSGAAVDLDVQPDFIPELEVSADGTRMLLAHVVWDLTNRKPLSIIDPGIAGDGFVTFGTGGLSPDGSLYSTITATASGVGQVTIVSTEPSSEAGRAIGDLPGPPVATAFRSDGTMLVVAAAEPLEFVQAGDDLEPVELWLAAVELGEPQVTSGRALGSAHAVSISRDGSTVALLGGDGGSNLITYDVEAGEPISTLDLERREPTATTAGLIFDSSVLDLSADGSRLAARVGSDVLLIDTASGTELTRVTGTGSAAPFATFTGDNQMLTLDGDTDGTWKHETWTVDGELAEMVTYSWSEPPQWMALGDGDRYLIVGATSSTVVIERASGDLQRIAGSSFFHQSDIGPERVLMSMSSGPQIWDLEALQPVGTAISSSFGIGAAVILDRDSRRDLIELTGAGGQLFFRQRSLLPDDLVARACQLANRNLTEAEWRRTFSDRPYRETCG